MVCLSPSPCTNSVRDELDRMFLASPVVTCDHADNRKGLRFEGPTPLCSTSSDGADHPAEALKSWLHSLLASARPVVCSACPLPGNRECDLRGGNWRNHAR